MAKWLPVVVRVVWLCIAADTGELCLTISVSDGVGGSVSVSVGVGGSVSVSVNISVSVSVGIGQCRPC